MKEFKKNFLKRFMFRRFIFFLCVAVFTGCCIYVAAWFIGGQINKAESRQLAQQFHNQNQNNEANDTAADQEADTNSWAEQNSDLIGWITIEGTAIDYPVVRGQDNEYYLTRDFYQKNNAHGAIFMDYRCSGTGLENTIIYGHHMKDGTMFQSLSNYKNRDYYEKHPLIQYYNRSGEEMIFEIIGIFYWDGTRENAFPFYEYTKLSEDSFDTYVRKVQEKSIYPIDADLSSPGQLLSLTTCDYFSQDARLIVVAKIRVE